MHGRTCNAAGCSFVPEYVTDDLLALKSMPSPDEPTVLIGLVDETALDRFVGVEKHPLAFPILVC